MSVRNRAIGNRGQQHAVESAVTRKTYCGVPLVDEAAPRSAVRIEGHFGEGDAPLCRGCVRIIERSHDQGFRPAPDVFMQR